MATVRSRILHGIDLAVDAGGATALLGANGAGKTTLMKTLAGVLPASAGRIFFRGEDITALPAAARVLAGIVLVPEGRLVFPELSVHDNLRLGAVNRRARADWRNALDEVHAIFPKLLERRHQAAATLSGGEQQMLAIGRGLMARPTLMLLDEPIEVEREDGWVVLFRGTDAILRVREEHVQSLETVDEIVNLTAAQPDSRLKCAI